MAEDIVLQATLATEGVAAGRQAIVRDFAAIEAAAAKTNAALGNGSNASAITTIQASNRAAAAAVTASEATATAARKATAAVVASHQEAANGAVATAAASTQASAKASEAVIADQKKVTQGAAQAAAAMVEIGSEAHAAMGRAALAQLDAARESGKAAALASQAASESAKQAAESSGQSWQKAAAEQVSAADAAAAAVAAANAKAAASTKAATDAAVAAHRAFADNARAASQQATNAYSNYATNVITRTRAALELQQGAIRAAVALGLKTSEQGAAEAAAAVQRANGEIVKALQVLESRVRSLNAQGLGETSPKLQDVAAGMVILGNASRDTSTAVQGMEVRTGRARAGFAALSTVLRAMVFQVAGVPGPIGRLAATLSAFIIGPGGIALAVTAGIAAIGFAYTKLAKDSIATETQLKKLRDEFKKQREEIETSQRVVVAAAEAQARAILFVAQAQDQAAKSNESDARLQKSGLDLAEQRAFAEKRVAAAKLENATATEVLRRAEEQYLESQLKGRRDIAQTQLREGKGNAPVLQQELRGQAEIYLQRSQTETDPAKKAAALRQYYDILGFIIERQGVYNELQKAESELQKKVTNARAAVEAGLEGGLTALEHTIDKQIEQQRILSEGQPLWSAYTASLGTSALKNLSFAQALDKDIPKAEEFESKVRALVAAEEELFRTRLKLKGLDTGKILGVGAQLARTEYREVLRPAPTTFPTSGTRVGDKPKEYVSPEYLDEITEARYREVRATEEARQASIAYARGLGAVSGQTAVVASAFSRFIADQQALSIATDKWGKESSQAAEASNAARISLAGLVAALGSLAFSGDSAADNVGRGVVAGVSTGIATGNPVAGIVTGAIGIVGGLLGMGKKAEEEARRMAEARKQWERALEDFGNVGRLAGTQFARQTRQLARDFEDAFEELKQDYPGTKKSKEFRPEDLSEVNWDMIRRAAAQGDEYAKQLLALQKKYNEALAETIRMREEELKALTQDLEVRALVAQGRTAEAATLALLVEQEQERAQLAEQYGEALTEAITKQVEYVQGLEREALARDQVLDAMRKQHEAIEFENDLAVRETALKGDVLATEIARLNAQANAERNRAALALEAGDITAEQYQRWINVVNGELTQAMDAAVKAAQEAAAAELELAAARKKTAEDDIHIRYLEATGQQQQADIVRAQIRQAQEWKDATEAGVSKVVMDQLKFIHTQELADITAPTAQADEQQQRAAQGRQELLQKVVGGITETTGTTFVGYLASMNVYLSEIAQNTASLRQGELRSAATVGAIASQGFEGPTAVARSQYQPPALAGVPPAIPGQDTVGSLTPTDNYLAQIVSLMSQRDQARAAEELAAARSYPAPEPGSDTVGQAQPGSLAALMAEVVRNTSTLPQLIPAAATATAAALPTATGTSTAPTGDTVFNFNFTMVVQRDTPLEVLERKAFELVRKGIREADSRDSLAAGRLRTL